MEKERRVKWLVIVSLIVAVLGLTIAFAALSETLTINGTATLDAAKWGIKFENLTSGTKVGDATINGSAEILEDKVTINNINVSLKTPGDSVTYKVDLVNEGSINAEISNIKVPELTEEQKRYIDFKVTYSDGKEVTKGDILNSETTKNLTIKIEFKKDITASDLPSSSEQINLSYELEFIQTDLSQGSNGDTSGDNVTGNYGNEIRSWDLSDTVKMTYYNGELQSDGTYDNGTLVISGEGEIPNCTSDNNITNIINGYGVTNLIIEEGITRVGDYAFQGCDIKDLKLSNSIAEFGTSSFSDANLPINLIIPDSVVSIAASAFLYTNIISVYIPSSVTNIGNSVFGGCTKLKEIYLSSGERNIGYYAFGAQGYGISLSKGSILYVPDEVTKNSLVSTEQDWGNGVYCPTYTTIVVDPTKFE